MDQKSLPPHSIWSPPQRILETDSTKILQSAYFHERAYRGTTAYNFRPPAAQNVEHNVFRQ